MIVRFVTIILLTVQISEHLGNDTSLTSAQLSCSILIKTDESYAQEETVHPSRSGWPEKLIDFEDLGNSEDDGFPDSWRSGQKIRRKDRVRSAPLQKKPKTIPAPFKMTIRFVESIPNKYLFSQSKFSLMKFKIELCSYLNN